MTAASRAADAPAPRLWCGQPGPREKPNEVCVGFSRDGWNWSRPDRRAFCPVSERETDWNYANVQSVGGCCLVVGDRLYFYVSGRSERGNVTAMATLRRDGFASMEAGPEGGVLTTRRVRFGGKYLFVNIDAPDGEVRAEALDEAGQVIAPFSADRCVPVKGDRTLQAMSWQGVDDLSALAGKVVKFRFHVTNGKFYSFWVSLDASGASHGYVAGGGPGSLGRRRGKPGYTASTDIVGIAAFDAVMPPAPAGAHQGSGAGAAPRPLMWPPRGKMHRQVTVTLSLSPTAPADATILVRTDVAATVRYATKPGIAYADMPNTMTTTDKFEHTAVIKGLRDGEPVTCYIKAQDGFGVADPTDYGILLLPGNPAANVPFKTEFEAESGELTPPAAVLAPEPWCVLTDETASGGRYVATPVRWHGGIPYKISVPETGEYFIWACVYGPSGNEDSYWVSIDGIGEDVFDIAEGGYAQWAWYRVKGRDNRRDNPSGDRTFVLAKGNHALTFRNREENARLDRIIITSDAAFAPEGYKPPAAAQQP